MNLTKLSDSFGYGILIGALYGISIPVSQLAQRVAKVQENRLNMPSLQYSNPWVFKCLNLSDYILATGLKHCIAAHLAFVDRALKLTAIALFMLAFETQPK